MFKWIFGAEKISVGSFKKKNNRPLFTHVIKLFFLLLCVIRDIFPGLAVRWSTRNRPLQSGGSRLPKTTPVLVSRRVRHHICSKYPQVYSTDVEFHQCDFHFSSVLFYFYISTNGFVLNLFRAAEVWMGDYIKYYFAAVPMARNVPFGKYVKIIFCARHQV